MTRPDGRHPDATRRPLGRFAALVGLVLATSLVARADDPKPAGLAPAPAPAAPTPPAPATAPALAPKAVALAFLAAIDKGDASAAIALLPAGEANGKWVEATIGLSAALKKIDAAAAERFGEHGKVVSRHQLRLIDAKASVEQAQEKVDGDAATLTIPGRAEPLRLKRVDNAWTLLVAPADVEAEHQRSLYARLTAAATRTTEEVTAGQYESADAAAKAFASRVIDARLAQ